MMILSYFCKPSINNRIGIGKNEFELLYLKGLINIRGQISKSKLREAEEYLQTCGWNGVFEELHDKDKFDKLADVIEFSISFNDNISSQIHIDERCFSLLLEGKFINDRGQIFKSKLGEAEEYLQTFGWNGVFRELHDKSKFDKLSSVIEFTIK